MGSQSSNSHVRACASGCYMVRIQFGWVGTANVRETLCFQPVKEFGQPSQDNWDFHKQLWLLWNYLFGRRRMLSIFSFSEKTKSETFSKVCRDVVHTKHRSPQNKSTNVKDDNRLMEAGIAAEEKANCASTAPFFHKWPCCGPFCPMGYDLTVTLQKVDDSKFALQHCPSPEQHSEGTRWHIGWMASFFTDEVNQWFMTLLKIPLADASLVVIWGRTVPCLRQEPRTKVEHLTQVIPRGHCFQKGGFQMTLSSASSHRPPISLADRIKLNFLLPPVMGGPDFLLS